MKLLHIFIIILLLNFYVSDEVEKRLEGKPICSDLDNEKISLAFDGDLSTNFVSTSDFGWIGVELLNPSKITKIGFYHNFPDFNIYLLGLFQGANDITFFDAVPLDMIMNKEKDNEINYININCNQVFKYVRYVGPWYSNSLISELIIYGIEYPSPVPIIENQNIYQPSNLPLLIINTENGEMLAGYDKEKKVQSNIMVIENKNIKAKYKAKIKLRGNSSLNTDKKSYTINLEDKAIILDLPNKSKKYALVSNFFDKSLIRNVLAYEISSFIKLKYTPSCTYADLIFNGYFQGNYILCEKIEVSEEIVNITKMDKKCKKEPDVSGGYLIEGDTNGQKDQSYFKTNKGIRFTIKYPKLENLIRNQYLYISNKFNEVENEIFDNNINSLDMDSFAKYFIIEEFCGNVDAIYNSFYIYKERNDKKLYFGPVWDMDLAFDNSYIMYPTNEQKNFGYKFTLSNGPTKKVVSKILSNGKMLDKIKDVWFYLINHGFNKEYLLNFIDEKYKLIYESQKLNFKRWNILGERVFMEAVIFDTYDEEVDFVKKFVIKRFETLGDIILKAHYDSVLKEYETQWDDKGQIDDDEEYGWDV